MEFKELISRRRSIRKYLERAVPRQVTDTILAAALAAPSSRNCRSTHFLVVEEPTIIARMADMRDYGSAFIKGASLVIVVSGEVAKSDLWLVNASIAATHLQLACVDEGLASCWVHIDRRPRRKEEPEAETAADYLRGFLPIPDGLNPFCAIAIGYSDFTPAPLPEADDAGRVVRV